MEKNYISTEEISVLEMIQGMKKRIGLIGCLVGIGMLIAITFTLLFEKVNYETKSTVVIGKEEAKLFYEDRYTENDIMMYEKIANTYIEIAGSDRVIKKVAAQYNQYTEQDIRNMVTPSYKPETLVIQLVGRGESRNDVMNITNTYSQIFIEECLELLPVGELMLMDEATFPQSRIPSKIFMNASIGVIIGALISLVLILRKMIIVKNTIESSQEVTDYLQIDEIFMIE